MSTTMVQNDQSRTDLDSHASMPVIGRHAFILGDVGHTVDVNAFSPEIPKMNLPLRDLAVIHDCPFSGQRTLIIFLQSIHNIAMEHNLVPPFIMREAGAVVNCTPKSQTQAPDESTHSIYWERAQVRIPLLLKGTFSYFMTRKPTIEELNDEQIPVVLATPEGKWDPNNPDYEANEWNLLDNEGKVRVIQTLPDPVILDEIPMQDIHVAAIMVSSIENKYFEDEQLENPHTNTELHSNQLAQALALKYQHDNYIMALGVHQPHCSTHLFNEVENDHEYVGDMGHECLMVADVSTPQPSKGVDALHLSKVWRIDLDTAQRTINATTQLVSRPQTSELTRNFPTNDRMLRYRRLNTHFFMDTFFATRKGGRSLRGNSCCQLFVTDKGFTYAIPMRSRSDLPSAVKAFCQAVGAPKAIICDPAREQKSHAIKRFLQKIGTPLRLLEEGTQHANRAELYIGLLKSAVRKDMHNSCAPLRLWDYCVERRARIQNLTAHGNPMLHGQTPHQQVLGEEGDISNLCEFAWYEWVYYWNHKSQFPFPRQLLGRCLGPATGEGNEMAQWVLTITGQVVPRRTLRHLTSEENNRETIIEQKRIFTDTITRKIGKSWAPAPTGPDMIEEMQPLGIDNDDPHDEDQAELIGGNTDHVQATDAHGRVLNQQPAYDSLIESELILPYGDELVPARVVGRTRADDGTIYGEYSPNPIMNTMMYDVEFPDGQVKEYAANVIAENLLSQVDSEGYSLSPIEAIVDHERLPTALSGSDAYVTGKNGVKQLIKSTKGWNIKVKWAIGTEQWIPLRILKESNPIEIARYAIEKGISSEPAFQWWVPYTMRKAKVIVSAVKARVRRTTHKYGIELPKDVNHAYELDAKNGNNYWAKAIQKEMSNVGIAFQVLHDKPVPPGWSKVTGHIIFDVKMSLERKARWVLDGHLTNDVEYSTYAGVVSRESVRIALTYAALNGLDVWAADIRNAYIQAPSSRKDFIYCGPEFGRENQGKPALIHRALYGGKTAGRDFRNHLRNCMQFLGFKPCRADPDVWMRPATNKEGSQVWEYVLLYTDDCLVISDKGESVLRKEIGKYFELKEESIGHPDIYLGGKLRKVTLENGLQAWSFGSSQYVQAAVRNVESYLKERGGDPLPRRAETPLSSGYRPEIDISIELSPRDASHYQSLIGILRWIVELGRVDICCEVSMLSSHLALPRIGHLKEVYHIFGYLKRFHNTEMVFDPTIPVIDEVAFPRQDWSTSEMDLEQSEVLPDNMPEPRGLGFVMRAYVDADHATDSMTRRSRSGFVIYLNNAPIYWMSKKQTGVETSSFGSEFTAMKLCAEYVRGLRYKLRMMGIACDGPTYIFGDNQSVLANTSVPESTLKKKSHSIAYHYVREGVARDEWRTTYISTHENPADLLTKPLVGAKRRGFVAMLLHHVGSESKG